MNTMNYRLEEPKLLKLRNADDTALFSTTPEGFNNLVQAVNKHSAAYKLSINAAKTNIMELDKWQENTNIVIDNIKVEQVQSFQYLGAMFTIKWRWCFQHKTSVGGGSATAK